jgi:drug/metabolite transporter (DMT)-like permease
VTLGPAVVYGIIMTRLKGAGMLQACLTWRIVAAAAAMVGAYTLVLFALRIAPAAPVAAVRETSVVMAVLLAGTVLHEPVKPVQLAGAGLVAVGIALLA